MDALALARWQFALTTIYHFFFVPLTLGLSVTVAIMETFYWRTGNETYRRMTKFFGKLFLINFAMGVVTGIVQEFQFGMNWSEYSRFVGDVFGVPLAIEALMAFFLESVFIGVWIFGWKKLSRGGHAIVMWLVAIGSNVSALWILIANSWMQQPVGYAVEGGRAVLTSFSALILNPNLFYQFPHTVLAGFVMSAFFVMGISVYHILRDKDVDLFKRSFQLAATIGTLSIILVILNGHSQAQHMIETQPMKMASAEALWETEPEPSFSILTIGNLDQTAEVFSIRIPRLLCLLSFNTLDCEVDGIYNLQAQFEELYGPGNYIPPVGVLYWSFRIMVGAGFLMLVLALYALFLSMGDILDQRARGPKIFLYAMILPYIANTTGWVLTEGGRFPWTVYGLFKLPESVSVVVSSGLVLLSLVGYIAIYSALIVATVYLLVKFGKAGPEPVSGEESSQPTESDVGEGTPSLVGTRD